MPEFKIVRNAERSPTRCFLCHDHTGPFVDTQIENSENPESVYMNIYICAPNDKRSGCAGQIANQAGFVSVQEVENRERTIMELEAEIQRLKSTEFSFTIESQTLNPAEPARPVSLTNFHEA
jgi:hypothetical protein